MQLIRFLVVVLLFGIISCTTKDKANKKDTSDLYAKSTAVDQILKRSGTHLSLGRNDVINKRALRDAENRLRTGGGLFGKSSPNVNSLFGRKDEKNIASTNIGLPINVILWKSSLEVVDFMPLASIDAFSGTIITDWYSANENTKERCKLNIFIKGKELKTENLKVNSFCQKLENNEWLSVSNDKNKDRQIEDAILNKAKKIKLSLIN